MEVPFINVLRSMDLTPLLTIQGVSRPKNILSINAITSNQPNGWANDINFGTLTLSAHIINLVGSISPNYPTGTVSFYDNGSLITTVSCLTIISYPILATFNWAPSASYIGLHTITATYSGDAHWNPENTQSASFVQLLLQGTVTMPYQGTNPDGSFSGSFATTPVTTLTSTNWQYAASVRVDPTYNIQLIAYSSRSGAQYLVLAQGTFSGGYTWFKEYDPSSVASIYSPVGTYVPGNIYGQTNTSDPNFSTTLTSITITAP